MKYLSNSQSHVLVLWGENFDAQMAITFITQLRRAKVYVKVVGLRGKRAAGMYGVALMPDITLRQAMPLAKLACCVVIPCHSPYLLPIANDPRIRDFFQAASQNQAQFVVGQVEQAEIARLINPNNVVSCLADMETTGAVNLVLERLL